MTIVLALALVQLENLLHVGTDKVWHMHPVMKFFVCITLESPIPVCTPLRLDIILAALMNGSCRNLQLKAR